MREENEEGIEVEVGDARAFYSDKEAKAYKKYLAKKGFVEERGFKKIVAPFEKDIERRGWKTMSKHMEPGRRALVKEFYANVSDRKNLTCYVRGR